MATSEGVNMFHHVPSHARLEDLHGAQQAAKESHQALEERLQKLPSCKNLVVDRFCIVAFNNAGLLDLCGPLCPASPRILSFRFSI